MSMFLEMSHFDVSEVTPDTKLTTQRPPGGHWRTAPKGVLSASSCGLSSFEFRPGAPGGLSSHSYFF